MKEEKKKKESENKIVPFDFDEKMLSDTEIDRIVRESMMEEADALEAELNQDPALRGADVSEDMFQSIVDQLKTQGLWEEDEETEKGQEYNTKEKNTDDTTCAEEEKQTAEPEGQRSQNGDNQDDRPQSLEELYALLPEEDRRALLLGKQMEKQEELRLAKKRKRKTYVKYGGIVAAVLVLVFSGSMTIEANRRLVQRAWDGMMYNLGFRVSTDYIDEEKEIEGRTEEELAALKEVSATLEVPTLIFEYMPEGMKYLDYEIMADSAEAGIFYTYQEKIFSVTVINMDREGTAYYVLDNEAVLREKVVNDQRIEARIQEVNLDLGEETYIAELEYDNCRCILNGMISLEEMKKIIKYAFIL
ncbi:MAG: DUF4367 domain-containing protein [Lachnospiraceae bacterium]|nr:DUF4367 domain-containing protein [Lachnospiraceae bacterium]